MKSKCTRSSISRTSFFTPCTRIVRFCYNVFRRPGFMPVINEYHGASSKQLLQTSVPVSMLRIFRAGTGTATLELGHMPWGTTVSRLETKMHAYNTTIRTVCTWVSLSDTGHLRGDNYCRYEEGANALLSTTAISKAGPLRANDLIPLCQIGY